MHVEMLLIYLTCVNGCTFAFRFLLRGPWHDRIENNPEFIPLTGENTKVWDANTCYWRTEIRAEKRKVLKFVDRFANQSRHPGNHLAYI
jgi:hypothetical protein